MIRPSGYTRSGYTKLHCFNYQNKPHFFIWIVVLLSILLSSRTATIPEQQPTDHRPWCSPDNLSFEFMLNVHPHLYLQGDGSFAVGFQHCRMRNFEGKHFHDVHKAFKRNHILFFGDSLTRYTYISLAYFLSHRKWTASYAHQNVEGLSVCSEFQFREWSVFYEFTNKKLTTWRKPTTAKEVRRHPFAAMEVCDCKRKQTDVFFPKNCENRFMRIVPVSPSMVQLARHANESTIIPSLEGDLDNTQDDIRISYTQWWGKHKGHVVKTIANVPRSSQFVEFVEKINNFYCSSLPNSTLIPLTAVCELNRLDNSELPQEQMVMPYFPNELTEENEFFAEYLPLLNATHMVVNTGIWCPWFNFRPSLMRSMIDAAHKHLNSADRNNALKLAPFLLRETYMTTWFRLYPPSSYDRDREILKETKRTAPFREDVDVMWAWEMTKDIGGWHHVRHTNGSSQYWRDVTLSVDYLRRKGLLPWIREHRDAHLYPEIRVWKDVPDSLEEQFLDKYRGLLCTTELAKEIIDTKMNFAEDVGYIYEDGFHYAPYVYNEVNKLFLSAITPHVPLVEQHANKITE